MRLGEKTQNQPEKTPNLSTKVEEVCGYVRQKLDFYACSNKFRRSLSLLRDFYGLRDKNSFGQIKRNIKFIKRNIKFIKRNDE